MASINGIAHIQLTVRDMQRSVPFYRTLLHSMEMVTLRDTPDYFYCIGGRTGVGIAPVAAEFRDETFNQRRLGLHHVCFRARSRDDVDSVERLVVALNGRIVHGAHEEGWVPGYYSVLFEDPDGIRLEANFVPGKGHLEHR